VSDFHITEPRFQCAAMIFGMMKFCMTWCWKCVCIRWTLMHVVCFISKQMGMCTLQKQESGNVRNRRWRPWWFSLSNGLPDFSLQANQTMLLVTFQHIDLRKDKKVKKIKSNTGLRSGEDQCPPKRWHDQCLLHWIHFHASFILDQCKRNAILGQSEVKPCIPLTFWGNLCPLQNKIHHDKGTCQNEDHKAFWAFWRALCCTTTDNELECFVKSQKSRWTEAQKVTDLWWTVGNCF